MGTTQVLASAVFAMQVNCQKGALSEAVRALSFQSLDQHKNIIGAGGC